jgi:hypothetical protein
MVACYAQTANPDVAAEVEVHPPDRHRRLTFLSFAAKLRHFGDAPGRASSGRNVVWDASASHDNIRFIMRVNLIAHVSPSAPEAGPIPVSLIIKPACGLPGTYEYKTDSNALLTMLHRRTDLNGSVLSEFKRNLQTSSQVRLLGVDLKDQALEEIGYFID